MKKQYHKKNDFFQLLLNQDSTIDAICQKAFESILEKAKAKDSAFAARLNQIKAEKAQKNTEIL